MNDLKSKLTRLENIKERMQKEFAANGKTRKYEDLRSQYLICLSEVGKATENK